MVSFLSDLMELMLDMVIAGQTDLHLCFLQQMWYRCCSTDVAVVDVVLHVSHVVNGIVHFMLYSYCWLWSCLSVCPFEAPLSNFFPVVLILDWAFMSPPHLSTTWCLLSCFKVAILPFLWQCIQWQWENSVKGVAYSDEPAEEYQLNPQLCSTEIYSEIQLIV